VPLAEEVVPATQLEGRVALVTGAARGIGRAVALALAEAGADVAIGDVHLGRYEGESYYRLGKRHSGPEEDVASVQAVAGLGRRGLGVEFDVADAEQVRAGVAQVVQELGPIDILVNNAGIVNNLGAVVDMPRDAWDRELSVNLTGAFQCIQATLPAMAERGWGRIVNVASVGAETGMPLQPAYAASKAGLLGLTRSVARGYAERGITCNAVLPGLIATPLVLSMPEALRASMLGSVPAGRLGEPGEVAALIAFLASPPAAFVNGAAIPVDGGFLIGQGRLDGS
jgi:NAD(P)-dependent dehydrogenase (short-subunit alcohol dehydrogenase family)